MNLFRTLYRLVWIGGTILCVAPLVALYVSVDKNSFFSLKLRKWFFGFGVKALGICVLKPVGVPSIPDGLNQSPDATSVVLMSNHISYADILVLGSIFPYNFVSKEEVKHWPLIGWVAQCYGTLFISRKSHDIKIGLAQLWDWVAKHSGIVLFPESVTSDGCRVLPFKSSYFHLPSHVKIQPVSIVYCEVNDLPATRFFHKIFSWRGNTTLLTHWWYVLGIRKISAKVVFHPAFEGGISRKKLAEKSWILVQQGVQTGAVSCL